MKLGIKSAFCTNKDGNIIFKPSPGFVRFVVSCTIAVAGMIAGGSVWVRSVSSRANQVPMLSRRVDSMEVMQIGVWCIQKEILKKLDPANAEQRIEQIEIMMETIRKQQESKKDNKE